MIRSTCLKKVSFLFLLLLALLSLFYPKTKKKKESKKEKTSITIEARKKDYSYFSSIPPEVMKNIETGSPQSLLLAAAALRKSVTEYTENEIVLLNVISGILSIAYPKTRLEAATPATSAINSYTGALQSVANGVYDTSTGNTDFLTILLPSLVILKVDNVKPFYKEAEEALNSCLKMNESSVLSLYLLGSLYLKNKEYSKAIIPLKKAYNLYSTSYSISFTYATVLERQKEYTACTSICQELIKSYPADSPLLKLYSSVSFTLNNYNAADEYISRVLQQTPNDLPSLLFRIKVLMTKGDYIRAASLLDMYARFDSKNKDYLLLRSKLQYEWSHNLTAAIKTIEEALALYPNDSAVMLYAVKLSNASFSKVGGKSALEYTTSILQNQGDNEEAIKYSIETLLQAEEYSKAYNLSIKLIKTDKSTKTLLQHITICVKAGKKEEAISAITPLYKEDKTSEEVQQTYIIVQAECGNKGQALSLINEYLPSAQSRYKSFLYYERSLLQDKSSEAINDLRASLMSNPRNSQALFRLYSLYFDDKDYRKAQYYLKQVTALNPNNEKYEKLMQEVERLIEQ